MGRRVLIVSTVEQSDDALRELVGSDVDEVKLVVPVVKQSPLDWLANDEQARSRADEAAHRIAEALPVDDVDAGVGEADVALALQDALATFAADEVLVLTRPEDETTWLEDDAGAPLPALGDVPVRRVTLSAP